MNKEYIEHIAIYKNVYPEGYCEHLISEFERLALNNAGADRQESDGSDKHEKDDYQILIEMRNHNLLQFKNQNPCDLFFEGLQNCYDEYTNKYSILKSSGRIRATIIKMQRTGPGGGYHVWHCEQGPDEKAARVVVYMLYLNTLDPQDGAETEFLYQQKRINPSENTMVIWPAAYTHAHRGNPVLSNAYKYIVTGWFHYD